MSPQGLDARRYQDTVGLLPTGVTVITAEIGEEIHGMTANAVTSLSLNPMQIIICVAKKAKMAVLLKPGVPFTVNVLREDQSRVSNHFAGANRRPEVMPEIRFVTWAGGVRLEGALAAIGCETAELLEGGDHWIVIGTVVGLFQGTNPDRPLLYFRGRYVRLEGGGLLAPGRDDLAEGPAHIFYDPW
ncbi:MAG TPA: flavin reductase family protein [bacterium]|jgi:flavin reductase (DIM6/NTAB) family NADH-FMN oxidoreductase RutF